MSSDPRNENQPPSAWVWSQYRGDVSEPGISPRKTTTASNRERPPLIPHQSGIATGPMLVALILLAAGMAWWFSGAQHKPEATTQENAVPEPAASDAAEPAEPPATDPAAPAPEAQAPGAEQAAPAAAPKAEPESKPEPAQERPKKKKKKH